jgi:hypothetical protein
MSMDEMTLQRFKRLQSEIFSDRPELMGQEELSSWVAYHATKWQGCNRFRQAVGLVKARGGDLAGFVSRCTEKCPNVYGASRIQRWSKML